jgi:hypothetical protein
MDQTSFKAFDDKKIATREFLRPIFGLFILTLVPSLVLVGCKLDQSYESDQLVQHEKMYEPKDLSQARFMFDSFGTLNLQGLINVGILPTKVYGTAVLMAEREKDPKLQLDSRNLPEIMSRYGFLKPEHIANWDEKKSLPPKMDQVLGFLTATIDEKILSQRIRIEVSTINCSACHSGWAYDALGHPTKNAWLGAPSTTIDFDAYLGRIYRGLELAEQNEKQFLTNIKKAYPQVDDAELTTIRRFLMPKLRSTLKNQKLKTALPFLNGGPGITNGMAAFKKDAKILERPKEFHPEEAGFVSVPALWDRGFRSSLTADGAYGRVNRPRYFEITRAESQNPLHIKELAELASFFTFSAMGNIVENIESAIPRVEEVFQFLKDARPQVYPGPLDLNQARAGAKIYSSACASCHGVYDDEFPNPKLLSFPNKLIPQEVMQTDETRWRQLTASIPEFVETNIISKYIKVPQPLGGYVAPILTGVWESAPYFHNGSIPTLRDLFFPQERPAKFQFGGGHYLDFEKVGILLDSRADGVAIYPKQVKLRSSYLIYDTSEPGRSNRGHEKQVQDLTADEKIQIIEFLKLL